MNNIKTCFCVGPENCKDVDCPIVRESLIQLGIMQRKDVVMDEKKYKEWLNRAISINCSANAYVTG